MRDDYTHSNPNKKKDGDRSLSSGCKVRDISAKYVFSSSSSPIPSLAEKVKMKKAASERLLTGQ
jgi:hypothetical protein